MRWLDTRGVSSPAEHGSGQSLRVLTGTGDKGLGSSSCGAQPKAWCLEEKGLPKLPGLMLTSPRSSSCNLFSREVGCHGMLMITIP